MLTWIVISILHTTPALDAVHPGAERIVAERHTIAVITPERIITGLHCGAVEYGLTASAGRTVADCKKLSSSPFQGPSIAGGGHVLRLSQTQDSVFLDCNFERIERFRRSDGGFDNYLEFSCSEPEATADGM